MAAPQSVNAVTMLEQHWPVRRRTGPGDDHVIRQRDDVRPSRRGVWRRVRPTQRSG